MSTAQESLAALEQKIGYTFENKGLLERALTHPSYNPGGVHRKHYQRLEFLGDAVLGLVLAEALFTDLPEEREGTLTRYRSMLVKGHQLSRLAQELHLGNFIRMGESEEAQGGRKRDSILEDAFEALIGAVYRDGGLAAAQSVALSIYGNITNRLTTTDDAHNPKGRLQELLQPAIGNDSIEYRLVREQGPDHMKEFTMEVWIDGQCKGEGHGNSKKQAEEAAAMQALEELEITPSE